MSERIVHCRKLGKDLPGLDKPPYRNDLGKRLYEDVSKEAWAEWLRDSVKFINTYCGQTGYDLTTPQGQAFMFKQCEIYFGYAEEEAAATAFVPAKPHEGA